MLAYPCLGRNTTCKLICLQPESAGCDHLTSVIKWTTTSGQYKKKGLGTVGGPGKKNPSAIQKSRGEKERFDPPGWILKAMGHQDWHRRTLVISEISTVLLAVPEWTKDNDTAQAVEILGPNMIRNHVWFIVTAKREKMSRAADGN